ncbi:Fusaric acid resistance protein-like-domain-containing protein [Aspergillus alliaceus]|uniref:Fusaric acid resistance protein-like-domain-containing protein n=1 Tax=Petromyces alliaceus TaxID=209559 RepID=A0A5N7CCU6_PETAA|nr:Fusaric acid resistance protein-like-domain-containing protein [Aspergillus alliaceus]
MSSANFEASFPFADAGQNPHTQPDVSRTGRRSRNGGEQEPFLNEPISVGQITTQSPVSAFWHQTRQFLTSDDGVGVFKCSLAYLLGSLATLVPAVAALLGSQGGKHIVATITVYFHPARSRGSMYKALVYALVSFLYAAFISLTSMYVTIFFQRRRMIELGHTLVLILFVGVGFGFIGWTKQKMGDSLVNVACSLASLTSIIVLTKEGAVQRGDVSLGKVSQVLAMLLMGIGVTMTVSFFVLPVSAAKRLRSNLGILAASTAIMQSVITESFIQRTERDMQGREFVSASADLQKAHKQLEKFLRETKLEHYVEGREKEYIFEAQLVRWARDIIHTLGALHSSARLGWETLRHPKFANHYPGSLAESPISSPRSRSRDEQPPADGHLLLDVRLSEENASDIGQTAHSPQVIDNCLVPDSIRVTEMFDDFTRQLGPSMRSLVLVLATILKELPARLVSDEQTVDANLHTTLIHAIEDYRKAQVEAFASLHRDRVNLRVYNAKDDACFNEVSAICTYFSHSLLKFGEQLKGLLAIVEDLQSATTLSRKRSWEWVLFWRQGRVRGHDGEPVHTDPTSQHPLIQSNAPEEMEMLEPFGFETQSRRQSLRERIDRCTQRYCNLFRKDETRFAVKVGTGAVLYALPSFLSFTRPFYLYWKGEWGLISYMLVCSMTIGASNTTGYARFLGTLIGALCSIGVWYVTGSNAFGLALFGFFMATWTFYISLVRGQGPLGRFIMLTYNLSVLYAYSLSQRDAGTGPNEVTREDLDITKITLHRVGAVLSGCIWGVIITRGIWPTSARKKLKTTLRLVWLRLARIWALSPLEQRLRHPGTAALYMPPQEQLKMEDLLSDLESLRVSARYEFELNAPFPDAAYARIIQHTRSIVDALHAFDLQLLSVAHPSEREISILQRTSRERNELSTHINHLPQLIASSITSARPVDHINVGKVKLARDQLLASIFMRQEEDDMLESILDDGYSLLYAYVLVNDQIMNEMTDVLADIGRISMDMNESVS